MLNFLFTLFLIFLPSDSLSYTPPRIVNQDSVIANTIYPVVARENGLQETIFLELVLDSTGAVKSHHYLNTQNPIFIDVANQMVNSMRFNPAKIDGVHVRSKVVIPIVFTLKD